MPELLHSKELIGKGNKKGFVASNVYCAARPAMPRLLKNMKKIGKATRNVALITWARCVKQIMREKRK
jgi:hypothetical protein